MTLRETVAVMRTIIEAGEPQVRCRCGRGCLPSPQGEGDDDDGTALIEDAIGFVAGFYQRHPKLKRYAPKVVSKPSGGTSPHPEARQHGDEVWLFPKFWALDDQTRDWVFAHELGHYVQGQLASGTKFLDLAAKHGIDPWDTNALPYGQFNMDEAFADCFAARFLEPAELRRRYPAWAELLDAIL